MVILITGRAGAGKSTYARRLADELRGKHGVAVLDSEIIRIQDRNVDYTEEGRRTHLMKLAEIAARIERNRPDTVVLIAAIAPRGAWREGMRAHWKSSRLVYLPGGSLWVGTEYEAPHEGEYHVYPRG